MAEVISLRARFLRALHRARDDSEKRERADLQRARIAALRALRIPRKFRLPAMSVLLATDDTARVRAINNLIRLCKGGRPDDKSRAKRAELAYLTARLGGCAQIKYALEEAKEKSKYSLSYVKKLRHDGKWDAELKRLLRARNS